MANTVNSVSINGHVYGFPGTEEVAELREEVEALNNDLTVYYDNSTKKLYQRNADGTRGEEIKMGMPALDFANPLHTFSSGNLTYTCVKDCYLYGSMYHTDGASTDITINGTLVINTTGGKLGFNSGGAEIIPITKLHQGDVVMLSSAAQKMYLHIFEERS